MKTTAFTLAALLALGHMAEGAPQGPAARVDSPSWIWVGWADFFPEAVLEKTFQLDGPPKQAVLRASCDNVMTIFVNGTEVASHDRWEQVVKLDVREHLVIGENRIRVQARNEGGPAGLALRLALDGGRQIVTDESWQAAPAVDGEWRPARVFGAVGDSELAWSGTVDRTSFGLRDDRVAPPQAPEGGLDLHLPDGFEAELLYRVPKDLQGSWVSLAKGEGGELFASDQRGRGIFRITPAPLGVEGGTTSAERIGVEVSGAQGLCWAYDSLYANVYGQGLWRMRDTDGDGRLDDAKNLIPLGSGGEHGPHAVLKTPEGDGLYFIGGNHVQPPKFDATRAPSNWKEDLLLPRLWDAQGHARGILAPGGWIARCDPDGANVEILSNGYRNQYDIALDRNGEMFTYDADMEYDIGSPWYRPTRVCHVTSGSEFGWRSGTGKWPTYYEDSLPPVLEIGPGSPTGTLFGTGASFPARYQDALFLLDWTFGTIYAIHLEPKGASYVATKEEFAWAKPLGVTDAVIGDDGAMYFTVGGRGIQSALYRIAYRGEESVAPADAALPTGAARARALRMRLEAFHQGESEGAVDAAWPSLSDADRHVRFAARIAVENQPVSDWRDRATAESDPRGSVTALIALARQGAPADLPAIVESLVRLDLGTLDEPLQLAALRTYALAFARLGEPEDAVRAKALAHLEPLFPSPSQDLNTELARVLTYLGSETVVATTLSLMAREDEAVLPEWAELIRRNDQYGGPIAKMLASPPPFQDISYALILRNASSGWTPELRRAYFEFFPRAAQHPGGRSYSGFLETIRADATDALTAGERRSLAGILGEDLVAEIDIEVTPPTGPGRTWTVDEAAAVLGTELRGRDFAAGRNLFHATSCSTCHRFDGTGGAIGPDLTTVGNKFSMRDALESILEPDAVISDQYGSHLVMTKDGEVAEGLLAEEDDYVLIYPRDLSDGPLEFTRDEIQIIKESPTSQMPKGLVDGLNAEELQDLIAYLLAGGDENAAVFKD